MTAPVFLAEDPGGERVLLAGPEGRHAAGSRRLAPGEPVDVVDGRGTRLSCAVVRTGRDEVLLQVVRRSYEPEPDPRLVLVQALPKADRGELAVELATEVGVDEVVPWVAARCVMQWKGERGDRQRERWASTAREAAKQSRRSWVPPVDVLHSTAQLPARLDGATVLVLHGSAGVALTEVPLPERGAVVVVVGPEGGMPDDEVAALGGTPVRVGPTVLRTSTAGAAAVAVLQVRLRRW